MDAKERRKLVAEVGIRLAMGDWETVDEALDAYQGNNEAAAVIKANFELFESMTPSFIIDVVAQMYIERKRGSVLLQAGITHMATMPMIEHWRWLNDVLFTMPDHELAKQLTERIRNDEH